MKKANLKTDLQNIVMFNKINENSLRMQYTSRDKPLKNQWGWKRKRGTILQVNM